MIIIKGYIKARLFNFPLFSVSRLWSPYQGAGRGGGRYMFPWSLNVFWFYLLFPVNNTTCSLKCFKLSFPWSPKLLHCSLDPQESLSLFPIFVCLCYRLFMVEKIAFKPPVSSPWNPLTLFFVDCSFCHLNCLSCLCDSDNFIDMLKHIKERNNITFFKL